MKKALIILFAAAALAGCSQQEGTRSETSGGTNGTNVSEAAGAAQGTNAPSTNAPSGGTNAP
jgi:Prokaryotic membrane lipoprotein lipid attachment site